MKVIPITLCLILSISNALADTDVKSTNINKQTTTNNIILQALLGGEAAEQYNKGYYYLTGKGDVKQSNSEARKWFGLAAKSTSPAVRYKIGRLFETGTLYQQSYLEAVKHYSYAADKGDIYAINNLAILYLNGTGVTKDIAKGITLFTRAANRGSVEAQVNLGLYYLTATQEHQSIEKALKWFTAAATDNNPVALYYLAEHAFAEKDYVKAYDYYLTSAQQSNDNAQLKLAMLYGKGLGIEKNREQSLKWLKEAAKLENKQALAMLKSMNK
ncbi:MAG: sel1 repeat family protein [Colwellia sp.]|nr:sel1 repeat family protein [Colwellia sp.]